jgi:hypothetical protein
MSRRSMSRRLKGYGVDNAAAKESLLSDSHTQAEELQQIIETAWNASEPRGDEKADSGSLRARVEEADRTLSKKHIYATIPHTNVSFRIPNRRVLDIIMSSGLNWGFNELPPAQPLPSSDHADPTSSDIKAADTFPKMPQAVLRYIDTLGAPLKEASIAGADDDDAGADDGASADANADADGTSQLSSLDGANQQYRSSDAALAIAPNAALAQRKQEIAYMLVCRLLVLEAWRLHGHVADQQFAKQIKVFEVTTTNYHGIPLPSVTIHDSAKLRKNIGHAFTEGYLKTWGLPLWLVLNTSFLLGDLNKDNTDIPVAYPYPYIFGIVGLALSIYMGWSNVPMQFKYAGLVQGPLSVRAMQRMYWDPQAINEFLMRELGFGVFFANNIMYRIERHQPILKNVGEPLDDEPDTNPQDLITLHEINLQTDESKVISKLTISLVASEPVGTYRIHQLLGRASSATDALSYQYLPASADRNEILESTLNNWIMRCAARIQARNPGYLAEEKALAAKTQRDDWRITLTETGDGTAVGSALIITNVLLHLNPSVVDEFWKRALIAAMASIIGVFGGRCIKAVSALASNQKLAVTLSDAEDRFATGVIHQSPEDRSPRLAAAMTYYQVLSWGLPLLFQILHGGAIFQSTLTPGLKYPLLLFALLGAAKKTRIVDTRYMGRSMGLSVEEILEPFGPNSPKNNAFVKAIGADWYTIDSTLFGYPINKFDISRAKLYFVDASYAIGLFFLAYESLKTVGVRLVLPPFFDEDGALLEPRFGLLGETIGDLASYLAPLFMIIATLVTGPQTGQLHKAGLDELRERRRLKQGEVEDSAEERAVEPEDPDEEYVYTYAGVQLS